MFGELLTFRNEMLKWEISVQQLPLWVLVFLIRPGLTYDIQAVTTTTEEETVVVTTEASKSGGGGRRSSGGDHSRERQQEEEEAAGDGVQLSCDGGRGAVYRYGEVTEGRQAGSLQIRPAQKVQHSLCSRCVLGI